MAVLALVLSIIALGMCIWLGREVAGLKERWARLYGLRAAMVETETALQELMRELDEAGQTLLKELDSRLCQSQDGGNPDPRPSLRQDLMAENQEDSLAYRLDIEEKRTSVIALAQQGYTVEEIAQDAEIPKGEVQLILDLEKFRQ
ncbi:MAG: hypothetical protein GX855_08710 [Firmicutes bacterium]|jgi:hypothetical protein|nr:hypothetical protein [Bacillota bacterium]